MALVILVHDRYAEDETDDWGGDLFVGDGEQRYDKPETALPCVSLIHRV